MSEERKIYYAAVNHPRLGDDRDHPWKYAVEAYRVAPHVWQVGGNDDVCVYLLDTGEGLILLDTGYRASFYLMLNEIWKLGYDPRDIKKILLSHWHWDHVNGARYLHEMSGCEIWLSKEDEVMHQMHDGRTDHMPMVPYEVTNFYSDEPIKLGRFSIDVTLTPGHTPGVVTFKFDDTDDETGKTYTCAMHGGIGIVTMSPKFMTNDTASHLSPELPHIFVRDCIQLADEWKVDICLPSHLNQGNVKPNIPEDRTDWHVWIDRDIWGDVLRNRAEAVKAMYPEVYGENK